MHCASCKTRISESTSFCPARGSGINQASQSAPKFVGLRGFSFRTNKILKGEFFMKKICWILSALILFCLTACDDSDGAGGGGKEGKYAWVLVETVDHDFSEIKSTRENFEFTYTSDYSRGSYGIRWVYDGKTREVIDVKYIHGETYGGRCEFSEPPQTIGVGETVTLDVTMTETENTLSGWTGRVDGYAKFVSAEQSFTASSSSDIYFIDDTSSEKAWELTIDTREGISSLKTTISAIPPEGKRGDRIALRLKCIVVSLSIGTDYIYELQKR
jgi:hypothetical protein